MHWCFPLSKAGYFLQLQLARQVRSGNSIGIVRPSAAHEKMPNFRFFPPLSWLHLPTFIWMIEMSSCGNLQALMHIYTPCASVSLYVTLGFQVHGFQAQWPKHPMPQTYIIIYIYILHQYKLHIVCICEYAYCFLRLASALEVQGWLWIQVEVHDDLTCLSVFHLYVKWVEWPLIKSTWVCNRTFLVKWLSKF